MVMQQHPTHKNSSGFTLIELLTSMVIIGVLAGVAIKQYSQYKIRGYDAHSKQAVHDMNLSCKAYWTEYGISDEWDLAKSKEYGFVQHSDVVATLPSSTLDTFCASAKHNSSPNTFSIDSVSLISLGGNCSGAGGSVQTASVTVAEPENFTCKGTGRVLTVEEKRILEHVVISAIDWCQGGQSEWKPNPDKENQFEWKNNAIDSKIAKYKQSYLGAKESEGEGYRNRWQREADGYAEMVIAMNAKNFETSGPFEISDGATYSYSTHKWSFPTPLTEAQKQRLAVTTSSYMSSGERGFFRYSDNNTP